MKKTTVVSILVLTLALLPIAASAEDGAAVFQGKCKACHGADGKKLAKADLTTPAIQGKTEADLVTFLTTDGKHKSKVADEATAKLVISFMRTLK